METETVRTLPPVRRLEMPLQGDPVPARATIAFEANHDADVPPDRHIVVAAGRRGTWRITFVPEADLPPGARIGYVKVENSFRFAWRHNDYWPDAMDYVTVEDGAGRPLPFECDTCDKSCIPAIVSLPDGLAAGAAVVIRMGDQRHDGKGSYAYPMAYDRVRLACGIRFPEDSAFRPAPGADVSVRIVPCPPVRRYFLFAPSSAKPGAAINLVALAADINNNAIAPGPDARVLDADGAPLAAAAADGRALHARVRLDRPGIVRLRVDDPAHGVAAESNPVRVAQDAPWQVYWGELHAHSYDGVELNVLNPNSDPEALYRYGRDVTRLDFCGLAPHIFREHPAAPAEWWDRYTAAARRFDEPGRFVPFVGIEWRDAEKDGGDRNLTWKGLRPPRPDPTWRISDLYRAAREQDGLVVPHVGGAIAMPHHHDPACEPLCEMVSGHGQFEWFGQAYLAKGFRLGLAGGSDGHNGTPGHPRQVSVGGGRFWRTLRRRDSGWSGGPVFAVLAESLDRDALWDAMRRRRTYASTGARSLVDLRVNGAAMGSEIEADGPVRIEISVEGTAPVARVDLIRGDRRRARWEGTSRRFEARLDDRPPDGEVHYYVRVEQADGELLWTSPVWVRARSGGDDAGLPAWNEPEPVEAQGPGPAARHLPDLLAYLRTEERLDAFSDFAPGGVVASPRGSYAVFYARLRGRPIRIHWFFEFEVPRLRFEAGWVQYGCERILGAPWAQSIWKE